MAEVIAARRQRDEKIIHDSKKRCSIVRKRETVDSWNAARTLPDIRYSVHVKACVHPYISVPRRVPVK